MSMQALLDHLISAAPESADDVKAFQGQLHFKDGRIIAGAVSWSPIVSGFYEILTVAQDREGKPVGMAKIHFAPTSILYLSVMESATPEGGAKIHRIG